MYYPGESNLDISWWKGPIGIKRLPPLSSEANSMTIERQLNTLDLSERLSEICNHKSILLIVWYRRAWKNPIMVMSFLRLQTRHLLWLFCDRTHIIKPIAYALIKILNKEHGVFSFQNVAIMLEHREKVMI